MSDQFKTPDDLGKNGEAVVRRWLNELDLAHKAEKGWRDDVKRVLEVYAGTGSDKPEFNILWSNVQVLTPSLYTRTPRPDVRRRYHDADPTAKQVAEVLERILSFSVDAYDFDAAMKAAVKDSILTGRAVTRVRFKQEEVDEPVMVPVSKGLDGYFLDGDLLDADDVVDVGDGTFAIQAGTETKVKRQAVECEDVHWDDYRQSPARYWGEVRWIAYRHKMTHDDLLDNKIPKAIADKVPLNLSDVEEAQDGDEIATTFKRAIVWEIWDKDEKKVIFIAEDFKDHPLKRSDDPMELEGFWPQPRPMYPFTGDTMVPIPEYTVYEGQAKELDNITKRIKKLTEALKIRGVYDSTQEEIGTLLTMPDNAMIPCTSFALLAERGGLEKAMQFAPLAEIAGVLKQLYENRDQAKQAIFEIIGIADLLRGASKASETATAQNIKAQFGNLRLGDRQKEVQRFARDLFRIKAELAAEKFSPETMQQMTGKDITPDMLQILQADGPRGFRVDIETDSTIAVDEQAEQEAVTGLLRGIVEFGQGMAPLVQAGTFTKEAAISLLLLAVRRFRGSREVEDTINSLQTENEPGGGEEGQGQAQMAQLAQQLQQAHEQIQELSAKADDTQAKAAEASKKLEIEQQRVNAEIALNEQVAVRELELKERLTEAKIILDGQKAARVSAGPVN